jgi:hypothetical protein
LRLTVFPERLMARCCFASAARLKACDTGLTYARGVALCDESFLMLVLLLW